MYFHLHDNSLVMVIFMGQIVDSGEVRPAHEQWKGGKERWIIATYFWFFFLYKLHANANDLRLLTGYLFYDVISHENANGLQLGQKRPDSHQQSTLLIPTRNQRNLWQSDKICRANFWTFDEDRLCGQTDKSLPTGSDLHYHSDVWGISQQKRAGAMKSLIFAAIYFLEVRIFDLFHLMASWMDAASQSRLRKEWSETAGGGSSIPPWKWK